MSSMLGSPPCSAWKFCHALCQNWLADRHACARPQAANRRGVPVFNAPFSNTRSVAELVIGEVIALARQLGDRSAELHAGQWKKVAKGCFEVRGKTLGIVGYGHIGSQVRRLPAVQKTAVMAAAGRSLSHRYWPVRLTFFA